jgi:hypothetical protein
MTTYAIGLMGKKKSESIAPIYKPFISDEDNKSKWGSQSWNTGGPSGREPIANAGYDPRFAKSAAAFLPGLRPKNGEFDPSVFNPDGTPGDSMYEFINSATRPVLPEGYEDYDVVFAGEKENARPLSISNGKTADWFGNTSTNVWQIIRKPTTQAPAEEAAVDTVYDEGISNRPVTVGTLSYLDPNRDAAGQGFLSSYIRSTGNPLTT